MGSFIKHLINRHLMEEFLQALPIAGHLPDIFSGVKPNTVRFVRLPTGFGKSIGCALHVLTTTRGDVWVSEPTIPAVRGLFRTVKELVKTRAVGFAAGGRAAYTPGETRIVYMTTGHAVNLLLRWVDNHTHGRTQTQYLPSVFVADEIHHPSAENYVLYHLLRHACQQQACRTSVVICSATLDPALAAGLPCASDYHVDATPARFKVIVVHMSGAWDSYRDALACAPQVGLRLLAEHGGNLLVFVAGEDCLSRLARAFPGFDVFCISANTPSHELEAIFLPSARRRVYLATNVAESSLTMHDVGMVLDLGRQKLMHMGPTDVPMLTIGWVTKASARQRTGRAGRTRDGICVRMYSDETFAALPEHAPYEFTTIPPCQHVLRVMGHELDPVALLRMDVAWHRRVARRLTAMELIADNKITAFGREVVKYPVSIELAAFMVRGEMAYNAGLIADGTYVAMCCFVGVLETGSPGRLMWFPRETRGSVGDQQAYRAATFADYIKGDDLEAIVHLFRRMMAETVHRGQYSRWCRAASFSDKVVLSALNTVRQIVSRVYGVDSDGADNIVADCLALPLDIQFVRDRLAASFPDRILSNPTVRPSGALTYTGRDGVVWTVDARRSLCDLCAPEQIMAISLFVCADDASTSNLASCFVNLTEKESI